MNKQTEHDTREHLLATGEQLCMQRGFTGMGLSELLKTAQCLKGRFITTFARKKPSASPCLSDITPAIISVLRRTSPPVPVIIAIVFSRYQETLKQFCQQGAISGCLTVKLSAEVCDLSEDMRSTMDKGAQEIMALLARALEDGRNSHCLHFTGQSLPQAQVLYALWLGANLQAKISRSAAPLENALAHVKTIIATPEH